jgi:hypothetical protein
MGLMTARSDLAGAFRKAVVDLVPRPDDLDHLGPPAFTFRAYGMPNCIFEARPISTPPQDGWVGIMYRAAPGGGYRQAGVGVFQDGCWHNDKRKPIEGDLYWTAVVDG